VYLDWMDNIRDGCISRQIWWGHQIPIFYCDACGHQWADRGRPASCPKCRAGNVRQDPDVLDTWFSSWLWPFSVFNWPEQNADLKFYYPTNSLSTASEIIFFWVARMIMAGFEFMGNIPFSEVYIHGTVRANDGRKMSKSLGNSIDPLDIINEYSADALRFSLIMLTATGQDVYVSKEKFEVGRNFGTKIWNAARFMQMHKPAEPLDVRALRLNPDLWTPDDWHIVAKADDAAKAAQDCLDRFRFNDYAKVMYEFLWHEFCDWYVEYAKDVLYGSDEPRRREALQIMHAVFSKSLRLLHPLMPFLTEELWHGMGYGAAEESIMTAPWPTSDLTLRGLADAHVAYVDQKHELIGLGRTMRADYGIPPGEKVDFGIKARDAATAAALEKDRVHLSNSLKSLNLSIQPDYRPSGAMPSSLGALGTLYMSLGDVDVDAEVAKLRAQVEDVDKRLAGVHAKLANANFVSRAKPEVVEAEQSRARELTEKKSKLENLIKALEA
jgi:valyl-tRNA synthetase